MSRRLSGSVPRGFVSTSSLETPDVPRTPEELVSNREILAPTSFSGALSLADAVCVTTAIVSLVTACILASSRKPFWNDEINLWIPATDPSIRHLFWAASHGCAGGASPLVLLFVRGWIAVAGPSVLSVRLFSCAGFCLALLTVWMTLRRHLGFLPVAFSVLTVWCTSDLIWPQLVEGRGYGFYVFAAALAFAIFDAVARAQKISKTLLAGLAATSAALTLAHYFGIFYSGSLLLALLTWDRINRRFRRKLYLAVMSGWLVLVPWLAAMSRDAALLGDRSYFRTPIPSDLTQFFAFGISYIPLLAFVAIVAGVLATMGGRADAEASEPIARVQPVMILGLAWMLVPLVAYVAFHVAPRSVWLPRYMLPSIVGFTVVLAVLADRLLKGAGIAAGFRFDTPSQRIPALCWISLCVLLELAPIQKALVGPASQPIVSRISVLAPPGIPVVLTWQWEFMQANFYSRGEAPRYFYILDRELAMSPDSAIDEPLFYNYLTAWKKAGYWADRVMPSDEFLCRFDRFAVLDAPGRLWFSRRVLHNQAFVVESHTSVDGRHFSVVHRVPGVTLPNCSPTH